MSLDKQYDKSKLSPWQLRLHEIIFEADTPAGKLFDVVLLWAILVSVLTVMLESVKSIAEDYGPELRMIEWFFTVLFTAEYILRHVSVSRPLKYTTSFFGIIDLLAIIPTYLSALFIGSQTLLVIRVLRLLRVFRILKLVRFVGEAQYLSQALMASRHKIAVFLGTVITLTVILGTIMYLLEGEKSGFTSIPISIYWSIVTLTTVGYGDIAPQTFPGRFLASVIMILGYSIIAIPTGIVTSEMSKIPGKDKLTTQTCPHCMKEGHADDAVFCKSCGGKLNYPRSKKPI